MAKDIFNGHSFGRIKYENSLEEVDELGREIFEDVG